MRVIIVLQSSWPPLLFCADILTAAWMTDHVTGDHSSGISSSSPAAISGYAGITLPAGDILGLPIGISFIGAEFSDAELVKYAYALEQAGYVRRPPLVDRQK